jgi:hypothetical protein
MFPLCGCGIGPRRSDLTRTAQARHAKLNWARYGVDYLRRRYNTEYGAHKNTQECGAAPHGFLTSVLVEDEAVDAVAVGPSLAPRCSSRKLAGG